MSAQNQGCLGFLGSLMKLFGSQKQTAPIRLPYRLRDHFLNRSELALYQALAQAAGDRVAICPNVSLKTIFSVDNDEQRQSHVNRYDRRYVSFLLCDAVTMLPLLGLEVEYHSKRSDREGHDGLMEQIFGAAGLPLVRVPARSAYSDDEVSRLLAQATPAPLASSGASLAAERTAAASAAPVCPKCGVPMVLRTSKRGEHAGQRFYGCPNYPSCRETVQP